MKVFKCAKCGYEDSSFIPCGARHIDCVKEVKDGEVECPHCHEVVPKVFLEAQLGKGITIDEYNDLVKFIQENHSFNTFKGKHIKYIRCSYDTRTNSIYGIELDDKKFYIVNENKHRNLKDWVYSYLKGVS